MLTAKDIKQAESRIRRYVLETPVEFSPALSALSGGDIWLKLEHIQRTGSFKLRGATNKLLALSESERKRGAITASTGNHGAAFAYIAHQLGCPGSIYLPETVAPAKLAAMQAYPVELHFHGEDALAAELKAREVAEESGRPFISPYNDYAIMAGQGTIGIELERQLDSIDSLLVSVGGGGMISGIATYLKDRFPQIEIIGCLPKNSPFMYESVQQGSIWDGPSFPTLSDGTAGGMEPDSLTFPICQELVDDFVLLSEEEIGAAMRWLLETHFHMVEGAAALTVAAVLQQPARFAGKRVGLVLCGRKIGIEKLKQILF